MFKFINTMMICLLVMGIGSSITTVTAQSNNEHSTSILTLKGDVSSGERINIMLFTFDAEKESWVKTSDKNNRTRYKFKLDPKVNYQVWFTNKQGDTKVLFVEAGDDPGLWFMAVDIDYTMCGDYARIWQIPERNDYGIAMCTREYSLVIEDRMLTASIDPYPDPIFKE